jgi:crotonobetainyl-CoA hydratase/dehydration protein DpgD
VTAHGAVGWGGNGRPRVRYEKAGRVATVTLDRPHRLNAMDLRTHEELRAVWDDLEADPDIWVGVVTGAGDRAFSVGQDLHETARLVAAGEPVETTFGSAGRPGYPRLTERFGMTKPLIAKVRGYALGGGFELALACDIIVAAEDAQFGLPEVRLGLIAGAGGVFRLSRQLPFRVALGHLMTGRPITAAQAIAWGLVNEVVPADRLDACVDAWVADLLACAPLAVRAVKQAAWSSSGLTLEEAFHTRFPAEDVRVHSRDAREGPVAFAEKRQPRWTAS